MKLSHFSYELPPDRIAYYPTEKRTESRLMVVGETGIQHLRFQEIITLLNPGDCLVLNNTRVIPARLYGQKTSGGKIELLIERVLSGHQVLAHIRASKSPKPLDQLHCDGNILFEVQEKQESLYCLTLLNGNNIWELLEKHGHIPLPPYIARVDELSDKERYQTVYAQHKGSVAAPTAGLHFDQALLQAIRDKGIEIVFVTLHVGAGTFQPVRTEELTEHVMHSEWIELTQSACEKILAAKKNGGRIIAVGTTATRTLESASRSGRLQPFTGETDLFIYPGYRFHCVDVMITNFHLPQSSLLMLVCAFSGYETIMNAYRLAIAEHYRFFSYGDAMMLFKKVC